MADTMTKPWVEAQIFETELKLRRAKGRAMKSHDFLAAGSGYLLENYLAVLKGDLALPPAQ